MDARRTKADSLIMRIECINSNIHSQILPNAHYTYYTFMIMVYKANTRYKKSFSILYVGIYIHTLLCMMSAKYHDYTIFITET